MSVLSFGKLFENIIESLVAIYKYGKSKNERQSNKKSKTRKKNPYKVTSV